MYIKKYTSIVFLDCFLLSRTDTFNVKDSKDLTDIDKIEIKRGYSLIGADWLLDKVSFCGFSLIKGPRSKPVTDFAFRISTV